MKVIKWISYDEAEQKISSIDRMGGFFGNGMRWSDYIANSSVALLHLDALRAEIIAKDIRITGQGHQYADNGVPVFEDGTVGLFSYRAWGDLMAAIWSTEENKDYNYMEFYM